MLLACRLFTLPVVVVAFFCVYRPCLDIGVLVSVYELLFFSMQMFLLFDLIRHVMNRSMQNNKTACSVVSCNVYFYCSSSRVAPGRFRAPRCVTGPGGLLPPYTTQQSQGQEFLYNINKQNYSEL
jgi:hypothetical protein